MQQQGCNVSGAGLFYEQQEGGGMSRELRATKVRRLRAMPLASAAAACVAGLLPQHA
jgi:hypothetical protein